MRKSVCRLFQGAHVRRSMILNRRSHAANLAITTLNGSKFQYEAMSSESFTTSGSERTAFGHSCGPFALRSGQRFGVWRGDNSRKNGEQYRLRHSSNHSTRAYRSSGRDYQGRRNAALWTCRTTAICSSAPCTCHLTEQQCQARLEKAWI